MHNTNFVYFLAFNSDWRCRHIDAFSDHTGYTGTVAWQQYSCIACRLLPRPSTVRLNEAAFDKLVVKFLALD